MDNVHSQTVSLIWNIADDVLRDVFVRGQYRDVILPMVVLRRLDALLEPTKEAVDEQVAQDKELGLEPDEYVLNEITGLSYYNTSRWTLSRLKSQAVGENELLLSNFMEYLMGFSPNVQDVLNKFEFFNKASKLASRDCLLSLIEKITDPYINLTDKPAKDPNGLPLPAVSNYDMGTIFEELLRRFNEENNEEAGEHFTPRDVIHLLSQVVFDPVKENLPPIVQIYDPACGSGGMLTEASEYLVAQGVDRSAIEIAGTEINPETYAICKSDLIIKSVNPDGIYCGNTITDNHFGGRSFGYMITNPPYGKSWKEHKKLIYHDKELLDDRFRKPLVNFAGEEEQIDCCPRTSDGQLLFVLESLEDVYGVTSSELGDYGFYPAPKGKELIVYESDSDLRDREKIPVGEDIHEYFLREVKPYAPDAWINLPSTKIGCEISFNKYFYEPKPLRSLEENEADIIALDEQSQGFIRSLLNLA